MASVNYRADIDGLRAIAVLSVLFYHAGSSLFSGGYVGVDVFFVISGYLITSIIIREITNSTFSITQFYERRFRRILPALITVMFFSIAVGCIIFPPNALIDLAQSAVATSIFSSNILFYLEADYFDAPAELKPLLHTWSLAVEEQYYIFFPLLLIAISKINTKHYFNTLIFLAILSFISCVYYTDINTTAAFYLIPTRAWELFFGSILALHVFPIPKRRLVREILSISGTILILYAIFYFTAETNFPGYKALYPTLGAALIMHAGSGGKSYIVNALSYRPLVFIGLISYSLYLWHWPIIVYTKYYFITELNLAIKLTMITATFALSILTWKYIEAPFRKKKFLSNQKELLLTSTGVSFIVIFLGFFIIKSEGLPYRNKNVLKVSSNAKDHELKHWIACESTIKQIVSYQDFCNIGSKDNNLSFFFWGDSHARSLAPGLDISAKKSSVKGKIATLSACPPLLYIERKNRQLCFEFNQSVIKEIANAPEIKVVVLAARWALSTTGTRYKNETGRTVNLVDLKSQTENLMTNINLFETGMNRTIEELNRLGKQVIIINAIPEIGYDVPSAFLAAKMTGRQINQIISPSKSDYLERTKELAIIFNRLEKKPFITLINPASQLCNNDYCQVAEGVNLLYRDNNHLSTFGSKHISSMFDAVFEIK